MRDLLEASRFACAFLKRVPLRPLLGVLAVSATSGALPMMLTAIYSVVRLMADCYRDAVHRRTHLIQRFEPLETL